MHTSTTLAPSTALTFAQLNTPELPPHNVGLLPLAADQLAKVSGGALPGSYW